MTTPFDTLLEQVRASLHARRLERLQSLQAVHAALSSYELAVEREVAAEFAHVHGLKQQPAGGDVQRAAEELLRAVEKLPELQPVVVPPPAEPKVPKTQPPPVPLTAAGQSLPLLELAAREQPLVVVGGVPRVERLNLLAAATRERAEWIGTTRQGTHGIGNLEKRLRDRRVSALILVEGSLGHKHSEPLKAAARQVGIPCSFAGKGGKAEFDAALLELEAQLARRTQGNGASERP